MIGQLQNVEWFHSPDILPYVYVRSENRIQRPGSLHKMDWFTREPVYINPLHIEELPFAEQIYFLEGKAFGPANMQMPRWVFYDCAVIPGFVAGFAMRTAKLPAAVRASLNLNLEMEWTPLSLFIIIPTMHKGEWVAHNLCSVNSLVEKQEQFYGLGFLSKAFGLWYANVESCTGMTQWSSPARKLHSHYGHMQVITSYSPVHSHAETLTYRVNVNTDCWEKFFSKEPDLEFLENYRPSELVVEPDNIKNLIQVQKRIEIEEGPFYLSASEIAQKKLNEPLSLYVKKTN